MTDLKQFKPGLRELPPDDRDVRLGALVKLPALKDLPRRFNLGDSIIKDQDNSDFCTAFASATASELQEGVELSPEWIFAVGKMIDGDVDSFGLDLRTVCKVHTKYGAIESKDAPFSIKEKSASFLRHLENWDEGLFDKAVLHKKKSYASAIEGPYDAFDNIRASIYYFRNERRAVFFGVIWSWGWDVYKLLKPGVTGEPHCIVCKGWDEDGLIIQNSGGKSVGKDGYHRMSREVVNKFASQYGAYMFLDYTKDELQWYLDNRVKLDDHWLLGLLKSLIQLMRWTKNIKPSSTS